MRETEIKKKRKKKCEDTHTDKSAELEKKITQGTYQCKTPEDAFTMLHFSLGMYNGTKNQHKNCVYDGLS